MHGVASTIDLGDPDTFVGNVPVNWLNQARTTNPIQWHHSKYLNKGFWVASSSALYDRIMTDAETFSSEQGTVVFNDLLEHEQENARLFLINMDPPRHTQFRRIISRAFNPDSVNAMGARIDAIANDVMDAVPCGTSIDAIATIATEMPLRVMCDLLGADPKDRLVIGSDAEAMGFPDDPELQPVDITTKVAAMRLFRYGMHLCETRNYSPKSLVNVLADGQVNDETLAQKEFCYFFTFLLLAGYLTTKSVLGSMISLLAEHPDQLRLLKERPELIPTAVEEILRIEPPNLQFCRTATRAVTLADQEILPGQKIAAYFHPVNRDPLLNSNPDVFDVSRHPVQHRSFGKGIHHCMGAFLARRELQALLKLISQRFDTIDLVSPPVRCRSNSLQGLKSLMAQFN